MSDTILYTIASLSGLGLSSAFVLYVVAWKFSVYEDPKVAEVEEMLPGVNCGGCGSPGCKPFAQLLVDQDDTKIKLFDTTAIHAEKAVQYALQ